MSILALADDGPVGLASAAAELRGQADTDPDSELQPVSSLAAVRAAARERAREVREVLRDNYYMRIVAGLRDS
eukprot:1635516-Prymnesium_polylepis.1